MKLSEFLEGKNIKLVLTPVENNPNMDSNDMINYHYQITMGEKTIQGYYSTGFGWVEKYKGRKEIEDINGYKKSASVYEPCYNVQWSKKHKDFLVPNQNGKGGKQLASNLTFQKVYRIRKPSIIDILDCLRSDSSCALNNSFQDFCDEFGCNADSIKDKKTYEACQTILSDCRKFFGKDFNAFIELEGE